MSPSIPAPSLVAVVLLLALASPSLIPLARASSTRPPPLHSRALSHPHQLSSHIIPRTPPPHPPSNLYRRAPPPPDPSIPPLDSVSLPAWDDRFLLSFLSHNQPVTLSLRPAANLVAPSGIRSTERARDPQTGAWTSREQVLGRSSIRAYEGWVLGDAEDVEMWIRGEMAGIVRQEGAVSTADWARIVLLPPEGDNDDQLRFQGSFTKDGEQYTVHSTDRYLRTKDPLDPDPPLLAAPTSTSSFARRQRRDLARSSKMVIVRERDTLSPSEQISLLRKRGLPLPDPASLPSETSCSHDTLPFNTDPAHPVLSHALAQAVYSSAGPSSWFSFESFRHHGLDSPFAPTDHSVILGSYPPGPRLRKRQGDDIGGGSGTSSNFINSIGSTSGCPKSAMVVFVGVAADCTYTETFDSSAAARTQILTDFNSVSALYQRSFNVSIGVSPLSPSPPFLSPLPLSDPPCSRSSGIVQLAVMSESCPTTSSQIDQSNPWNLPCASPSSASASGNSSSSGIGVDLNSRLSIFSQWRGDKGAGDGAGLWHLLTACQTGSEVGVAWLGQLCKVTATSSGGQTTSGTAVTAITRSEWQVIAHEIGSSSLSLFILSPSSCAAADGEWAGHNFGAIHDCASGCSLSGSCCPLSRTTCDAQANYIMSPVSIKNVSSFSTCSIGNICSTIGNSLNTTCLATPAAAGNPSIISASRGYRSRPFANDRGPTQACNPAATASSKPVKTATRAVRPTRAVTPGRASSRPAPPTNSLCCTAQCQVAGNGTVCRPSMDPTCDTQEVCDGRNATCPADVHVKDGTSCGSDGLACASGICTSRSLQCQNAGSSLNLTSACPQSTSSSCSITCADPTSNADCIVLDQSFRDGTSCGYGGRCENGACQTGSALDTAKSWYTKNLRVPGLEGACPLIPNAGLVCRIAIPVTIVVGIIVLLLIFFILRCCCCRRHRPAYVANPPKNQAYSAAFATPPSGYYGGQQPNGGGSYYAPPPGPPPAAAKGSELRR
ncbi:SPOSA6832_02294, partial [Sporobolomyces salmonicolor]